MEYFILRNDWKTHTNERGSDRAEAVNHNVILKVTTNEQLSQSAHTSIYLT